MMMPISISYGTKTYIMLAMFYLEQFQICVGELLTSAELEVNEHPSIATVDE